MREEQDGDSDVRKTLEDHLIPLVVHQESTSKRSSKRSQSMQLPPPVDLHDPGPMNAQHHPTPISLAGLLVDGVLVPRSTGGVLHAVEDVGEVGMQGPFVPLGEPS